MTSFFRNTLAFLTASAALFAAAPDETQTKQVSPSPAPAKAALRWLDGAPTLGETGTTLGVPWPRGTLPKDAEFTVSSPEGKTVPVQTWPLATWPDGSLKWSALALPAGVDAAELTVAAGKTQAPANAVTVQDNAENVVVSNGIIECTIAKKGSNFLSIARGGKVLARDASLVALNQDKPDSTSEGARKLESFASRIESVTVEQTGPVRAVVKITGTHANAERAWLPFVVRLYVYAGADSVRIMHTFVFDGDEQKDFIKGIGLRFAVPMSDELYNRHIRFVGAGEGVWAEAVRTLTGLRRDPGADIRKTQIDGKEVGGASSMDPRVGKRLDLIPAWGDFELYQSSSNAFSIRKRTKDGFGWIDADEGTHAAGVGYIGGAKNGGVVFGVRDFWQRHPTQLDVRGADTDKAEVTIWLWSPNAPSMDLRFYHDTMGMDTYEAQREGLEITYEDYEPGFGTAHGVARSSELTLWALPATPARESLVKMADAVRKPAQLVCAPETYLNARVFGALWSMPDRSTPAKKALEDRLDTLFEYYKTQVTQRHWYGFWNYGDIMHTYDADRHVWRYDVGGYAWDNSELSPDLWLWYSFLRTGRADIFRFAETMIRHTSEVDIYHLGRFAGLGSRHNVQHWGCSAKQARISSAVYRRFYYFMTGDERIGDILRELLNADRAYIAIDPVRKVPNQAPKGDYPARISIGTDWCSLAAAWLTEWERSGDAKSRDKLLAGMRGIGASKYGFYATNYGYNPDTGDMTALGGEAIGYSHLNSMFGAVEICTELVELTKGMPEQAGFDRIWMQYCSTVNSPEDQKKELPSEQKPSFLQSHSRLVAYAAWRKKDPAVAKRAWHDFYSEPGIMKAPVRIVKGPDVLNPVVEAPGISTNETAQFGLAAIQNLCLIGEELK